MLIGKTLPQPGDIVNRSWAAISPFMTLSDDEAKYITSIQRGKLHAELLFPDAQEEAKRMASHPAILWKLVNARAHVVDMIKNSNW